MISKNQLTYLATQHCDTALNRDETIILAALLAKTVYQDILDFQALELLQNALLVQAARINPMANYDQQTYSRREKTQS